MARTANPNFLKIIFGILQNNGSITGIPELQDTMSEG
jgi:hypothetical protein